jgi:pimeloyl-ACP methyl ester carboxylesterase
MMKRSALLALVLAAQLPSPGLGLGLGGCTDGITCANISANELVFQCRIAAPAPGISAHRGDVLMLHGFPEWSEMYMGLMRSLAAEGFRSIACNQRGYSVPRPDGRESYDYAALRDDVFAIAAASNFSKFHLVGHDHGACLGWFSAGSAEGRAKVLSYSSLSIPHPAAFNAALAVPAGDVKQQVASQYITMFVLNDSAAIHNDFWYNSMGKSSGDKNTGSFPSAAEFQKALWWYNGAIDTGVLSLPPLMSAASLLAHGAAEMAYLRGVFGGKPNDGKAATVVTGNATMPVLFVCGKSDPAILCNRPYALTTSEYCSANYTYLEADCGHDLLSCAIKSETDKVVAAIVHHVSAASAAASV